MLPQQGDQGGRTIPQRLSFVSFIPADPSALNSEWKQDYNVRRRVREPAITVRKQSPSEAQQTPKEHVGLGISSTPLHGDGDLW